MLNPAADKMAAHPRSFPIAIALAGDGASDPERGAPIPIEPAAGPRAPHVIAYRMSLPFLGRRYYFAVFAGREQRSLARLVAESQRKSWWHTTFSVSALLMCLSTGVMCALATAYLVKSMLGIDLFDEHFFLHRLFFG